MLGPQYFPERDNPGDVAAWVTEAGHQPKLHRVTAGVEHYRNSRGRLLRGKRRSHSGRSDHGDRDARQFRRQRRQPLVAALAPAILDLDAVALREAGLGEPLPKTRDLGLENLR